MADPLTDAQIKGLRETLNRDDMSKDDLRKLAESYLDIAIESINRLTDMLSELKTIQDKVDIIEDLAMEESLLIIGDIMMEPGSN